MHIYTYIYIYNVTRLAAVETEVESASRHVRRAGSPHGLNPKVAPPSRLDNFISYSYLINDKAIFTESLQCGSGQYSCRGSSRQRRAIEVPLPIDGVHRFGSLCVLCVFSMFSACSLCVLCVLYVNHVFQNESPSSSLAYKRDYDTHNLIMLRQMQACACVTKMFGWLCCVKALRLVCFCCVSWCNTLWLLCVALLLVTET